MQQSLLPFLINNGCPLQNGLEGWKHLLLGFDDILETFLHMAVPILQDGLQEGQHLVHYPLIRMGEERDYLERSMCNIAD